MKSILINGFFRSGTTFLNIQAIKNGIKMLHEPLSKFALECLIGENKDKIFSHTKQIHNYFDNEDILKFINLYKEVNNINLAIKFTSTQE